jgi:hypothetical protein
MLEICFYQNKKLVSTNQVICGQVSLLFLEYFVVAQLTHN